MSDPIHAPSSANEIASAVRRLREVASQQPVTADMVLDIFERWSAALDAPELREIPGLTFLRLWLRRGTLQPMLLRELGPDAIDGGWQQDGRARLRAVPLGVIGHWPAGNVEIQPMLSLSCTLLGGNTCIVRIPTGSVAVNRLLLQKLHEVDRGGLLEDRIFAATFEHSRTDFHEAMAKSVDGAMVWGGQEAVSAVRALPFPHWARVLTFGPRLSVAAMDAAVWSDQSERASWCRRIARDVWQFGQQACSSPQALFFERGAGCDPDAFVRELARAFAEENRAHPRQQIEPALTSAICRARANWLLDSMENSAIFPQAPDWTILQGTRLDIPKPTQGRTLNVLIVDDLFDVVSRFDGAVQTLGVAVKGSQKEEALAEAAARRGVDRIVKLGQMHVFGSPWDGADLVRPMVRLIRYVPSSDGRTEQQNGRCATVPGSVGSQG
jgi:Acyl-CoA reductase (LuxC)